MSQPSIRFPGQCFDAETGLHYNRFWYYGPGIGRYLRLEPLLTDPLFLAAAPSTVRQQSHPYSYAMNDPVGYVDPDARFARTVYHFFKNYFALKGYVDDPGFDKPGPERDKYHQCVANCESKSDPLPGGEVAAWAFNTAKEEGLDRCRGWTGGSQGPDPEDWDANFRGLNAPEGSSCADWCSAGYPDSRHQQ